VRIARNRCFYAGVLLAFCALWFPFAAYAQQVSVTSQKKTYSADEIISITVANSLAVSIFTVAASSSPEMGLTNLEKKASVGWDAYPLRCRQPSCTVDYTIPVPEEIKPGKSVTFSWKPKIFISNKYVSPEPGTYRLTVLYQVGKEGESRMWNWTTVRSNTFTLE
jgi:hypothetical protein